MQGESPRSVPASVPSPDKCTDADGGIGASCRHGWKREMRGRGAVRRLVGSRCEWSFPVSEIHTPHLSCTGTVG